LLFPDKGIARKSPQRDNTRIPDTAGRFYASIRFALRGTNLFVVIIKK
jgi:hypothetical protein